MLNILVICTGNSCRSVISECLLNKMGEGRVTALSAGSHPLGRLNAGAVALLKRHDISTEGLTSQSWDEFTDQNFDLLITVCDNAAGETCPLYLQAIPAVHWGTFDPGHVEGTEEEKLAAFEKTYTTFQRRIEKMLALPLESMSAADRVSKLNAIGLLNL